MKSIEGLTPPRLILQVDPNISEKLRKSKRKYSITVHFVLNENGVPVNLSVSRPADASQKEATQMDEANQDAMDAVKQYRFTPALLDSKPVAVEMNVVVSFQPL